MWHQVNAKGQLVLIDFGLCASIQAPDSDTITHALVHLMQGDVPAMLQDAIALGFLAPDVDTTTLLPALQRVFAQGAALSAHDDALSETTSSPRSKYKAARRRKQLRALSADLNEIFFQHPFQVGPRPHPHAAPKSGTLRTVNPRTIKCMLRVYTISD